MEFGVHEGLRDQYLEGNGGGRGQQDWSEREVELQCKSDRVFPNPAGSSRARIVYQNCPSVVLNLAELAGTQYPHFVESLTVSYQERGMTEGQGADCGRSRP